MKSKNVKTRQTYVRSRIVAGLFTVVLATSLLVVAGPTQAEIGTNVTDSCEERITEGTHVLASEEHRGSCSFECNEEDYVIVEVINEGGRGIVTIVGECNGARAHCTNEVRSCEETIGSYLAEGAGTGSCRFKVDHYNSVDKIFRCKAISPQGGYQPAPIYTLCVIHWIDEWILGGSVGGGLVEVCVYEGNSVCIDAVGTFYHPESYRWIRTCGTDLVGVLVHHICAAMNGIEDDSFCLEV